LPELRQGDVRGVRAAGSRCALLRRLPGECDGAADTSGGWKFCAGAGGEYDGASGIPGAPPASGLGPSPILAFFLGFLPGLGAFYNEQYGKGIIHLAIFLFLFIIGVDGAVSGGAEAALWICISLHKCRLTDTHGKGGLTGSCWISLIQQRKARAEPRFAVLIASSGFISRVADHNAASAPPLPPRPRR